MENIYENLKDVMPIIEKETKPYLNEYFLEEINDSGVFKKAHGNKERLFLDDIFVYPNLKIINETADLEEEYNSSNLSNYIEDIKKIVLSGGNQSGKTTLCYKIFKDLFGLGYIPVYINDRENSYRGQIKNKVKDAVNEEYENIDFEDVKDENLVLIVDDFHYANKKEKLIEELEKYYKVIIIVDDVFQLNIKNEELLHSFNKYKIQELLSSKRYELVDKWVRLYYEDDEISGDNEKYKQIDSKIEQINKTIGSIIGNKIMPPYPFFILSILANSEAVDKPLEKEITSQGYCYEALIFLYLKKEGVGNDQIEVFLNFLTEFSFALFNKERAKLSEDEFNDFLKKYKKDYNLPISENDLIQKLRNIRLIKVDNFNRYSFYYPYIYYFFVAKYLSENIKSTFGYIEKIIDNLHKDENAYICIFITHHTKNYDVLDRIQLSSLELFENQKPAQLNKDELSVFEREEKNIVKAVLPEKVSAEKARGEKLKSEDEVEKENQKRKEDEEEEFDDEFAIELRRSVRTVEVMGHIIKNRAGSLKKEKLKEIYRHGMEAHLRILSSFFQLINQEKNIKGIIEYISEIIKRLEEEGKVNFANQDKQDVAKKIFWNLNFSVIRGYLNKIITSLGSPQLLNIVKEVSDEENTPASHLVNEGTKMWYGKRLDIDQLEAFLKNKDYSSITKKVLRYFVVQHYYLHTFDYKETQQIQDRLNIATDTIDKRKAKNN